jgi:hypothetical protein
LTYETEKRHSPQDTAGLILILDTGTILILESIEEAQNNKKSRTQANRLEVKG